MTFLDLTTLNYFKVHQKNPFDLNALTSLIYVVVAIRRQPHRAMDIIKNDSKAIIKNANSSWSSKKFQYLQQLIQEIKTKYKFDILESIAFVCWYSYNQLNFKSYMKNKLDEVDESMIFQFREWYQTLNANLHIIHGFKKSCKTIMQMRKKNGESAEACLSRLIEQDKISELYYTGGITPYFLAAIPKKKINIPKSAIFSSKLFSLVEENKDILISKLNNASKNYLKVPVNSIEYLNVLQHVKG